eukprot:Gregarina_sp_Pseudo_9__5485@NODE_6_length_7085_cov_13_985524_g4_i0_p3_GENE_NODE_6_length_7085_cov_13_985524_g4_i0NODE_6_length_7085_cov_13_985524_g4_i0_p3_ORF_typecomplete_len259_score48_30_NODE_6_length_7085_cov_13_985524_g4_i052666042
MSGFVAKSPSSKAPSPSPPVTRKIHFDLPPSQLSEESNCQRKQHSSSQGGKVRLETISLRSISGTTCDAFEDDLQEDEDDENGGALPAKWLNREIDAFFGVSSSSPAQSAAVGGLHPDGLVCESSKPGLAAPGGADEEEEAEAFMMEGYLLALVQRNMELSSSALLGLRHDLEMLSLSDLVCMLRTLFKLVEVLQCRNLAEVFRNCPKSRLSEVVRSQTHFSTTDAVRSVLLSLLDANKTDISRRNLQPSASLETTNA